MVGGSRYNTEIMNLTKSATRKYKRICYATFNKTYSAMLKKFRSLKPEINPEAFYFVDAITPRVFKTKESERCIFLDSLDDLQAVAKRILAFVKKNKIEYVIFDSVSSFLVYKDDKEAMVFFNYLLSSLEEAGVGIMLTVLYEDFERPLVKQLKMRTDHVEVAAL